MAGSAKTASATTLPDVMDEIERLIRVLLDANEIMAPSEAPPPMPGVPQSEHSRPSSQPSLLSPPEKGQRPHRPRSQSIGSGEEDETESEDDDFSSGLQMLKGWQQRAEEQGSFRVKGRKVVPTSAAGKWYKSTKWRDSFRWGRGWGQGWAMVSAMTVLQDCVSIPLLAFGHRAFWLQLGQAIFWTANMLVLPVLLKSRSILRLRDACLMYAQELSLVIIMYVQLIGWAQSVDLASATMDVMRLCRVLQLPRLYSWTGLERHVSSWMHRSSLEVRALVHMVLCMIVGAFLLHLLTCLWFAVRGPAIDGGTQAHYVTTLEWSLSRLHPVRTAENMLLPSHVERAVAVLASGLAMLFGSMFVSLITNDLADIRRARRERKESEHTLSDYLAIFPVSWDLEQEIKQFLRTKMASLQPPCKAEIAKILPGFLYDEISCEALLPVLAKHEFLFGLCSTHEAFRHDLCVRGLQDWNVAPQEVMFTKGPKCPAMLIVAHGCVLYRRSPRKPSPTAVLTVDTRAGPLVTTGNRDHDSRIGIKSLYREDWMCEHSLWTEWSYVGKAASDSRTTLITLTPEALTEVSQHHKAASAELIIYARLFVNALRDVPEEDWSDLQTPVPF